MGARVTDQLWTDRAGSHARLRGKSEAFDAGVELGPGDPEERRGLGLVPPGVLQVGEHGARGECFSA